MTTAAATITPNTDGSILVKWSGLSATITAGDDYVPPVGHRLAAVSFVGTFGGTVTLAASADGSNFATAEDVASVAISATAASIFNAGMQAARAYHPTAGAGVSSVDVAAYFTPEL